MGNSKGTITAGFGGALLAAWHPATAQSSERNDTYAPPSPAGVVVADQLARMIHAGVLRAGDLLPSERELGQVFEVARQTIRAAFAVLEGRLMIAIVHGRRSRVLGPGSLEHVDYGEALKKIAQRPTRELFEARLAVDTQIAALSTVLITTPDLERLERLANLGLDSRDAASLAVVDFVFHSRIYRSSGNHLLSDLAMDFYCCLEPRCRPGTSQDDVAPDNDVAMDDARTAYQSILAAFRSRDPVAAGNAVRQQILARIRNFADIAPLEHARAAASSAADLSHVDRSDEGPATMWPQFTLARSEEYAEERADDAQAASAVN